MYILRSCFFCPCLVICHFVYIVCFCLVSFEGLAKYVGSHSTSSSSFAFLSTCWIKFLLWVHPFLGTALSSSHKSIFGMVFSWVWHRGQSLMIFLKSLQVYNSCTFDIAFHNFFISVLIHDLNFLVI